MEGAKTEAILLMDAIKGPENKYPRVHYVCQCIFDEIQFCWLLQVAVATLGLLCFSFKDKIDVKICIWFWSYRSFDMEYGKCGEGQAWPKGPMEWGSVPCLVDMWPGLGVGLSITLGVSALWNKKTINWERGGLKTCLEMLIFRPVAPWTRSLSSLIIYLR